MTNDQRIPWLRIAAESVAIVASILLAFTIDAWWDDRAERNLESQQLARLKTELESNVRSIEGFTPTAASVEAGLSVVAQIEDALARDAEFINVSPREFGLMVSAITFEFRTSVFDGAVRSGRLDVIRDDRVISSLGEWQNQMSNYLDAAQVARNTSETVLFPELHKRGDTSLGILVFIQNRRGADLSNEGEIQLRVDSEIKGLITQKTRIHSNAEQALGQAREAAQAAIDAISAAQSKD